MSPTSLSRASSSLTVSIAKEYSEVRTKPASGYSGQIVYLLMISTIMAEAITMIQEQRSGCSLVALVAYIAFLKKSNYFSSDSQVSRMDACCFTPFYDSDCTCAECMFSSI